MAILEMNFLIRSGYLFSNHLDVPPMQYLEIHSIQTSVWICLKGSYAISKDGHTCTKWSPYTIPLAFLSGADFKPSAPHFISSNKMAAILTLEIENQLNYGAKTVKTE